MASSLDLSALLRRHKPEKRTAQMPLRDAAALIDAVSVPVAWRTKLLLDTNIYIRQLEGELPRLVADLVKTATLHHSTVCLSEIAVGLANRDVTATSWRAEMRVWERMFDSFAPRRTHAPDAEVWVAPGIVAGTLTRVQGFTKAQRKDALNDALIYLTAMKAGLPVLTENRKDFDRLQQLVPGGEVYCVLG